MPRPFGGLYFFGAGSIIPSSVGTSAGTYALQLDGNNIPYWGNTAGAATVDFVASTDVLTRPYINIPALPGQYSTSSGVVPTGNEFQQAFGNASGGPINSFGGNGPSTPATTPASALPTPQFGTPQMPWGLAIKDIFVVYSVQTVALTAATVALYRTTFGNNVAYSTTTVLSTTATTLPLATTTSATTPYVTRTIITQPVNWESIDYCSLSLVLQIQAASTSAVAVYGLGFHVVGCYS